MFWKTGNEPFPDACHESTFHKADKPDNSTGSHRWYSGTLFDGPYESRKYYQADNRCPCRHCSPGKFDEGHRFVHNYPIEQIHATPRNGYRHSSGFHPLMSQTNIPLSGDRITKNPKHIHGDTFAHKSSEQRRVPLKQDRGRDRHYDLDPVCCSLHRHQSPPKYHANEPISPIPSLDEPNRYASTFIPHRDRSSVTSLTYRDSEVSTHAPSPAVVLNINSQCCTDHHRHAESSFDEGSELSDCRDCDSGCYVISDGRRIPKKDGWERKNHKTTHKHQRNNQDSWQSNDRFTNGAKTARWNDDNSGLKVGPGKRNSRRSTSPTGENINNRQDPARWKNQSKNTMQGWNRNVSGDQSWNDNGERRNDVNDPFRDQAWNAAGNDTVGWGNASNDPDHNLNKSRNGEPEWENNGTDGGSPNNESWGNNNAAWNQTGNSQQQTEWNNIGNDSTDWNQGSNSHQDDNGNDSGQDNSWTHETGDPFQKNNNSQTDGQGRYGSQANQQQDTNNQLGDWNGNGQVQNGSNDSQHNTWGVKQPDRDYIPPTGWGQNINQTPRRNRLFVSPKSRDLIHDEPPLYTVPESIARERAVSHQVQPGPRTKYYHKVRTPKYLDTLDKPYAKFIFKYRQKGMFAVLK